jgi:transcription antitermination factor NusA-like protein
MQMESMKYGIDIDINDLRNWIFPKELADKVPCSLMQTALRVPEPIKKEIIVYVKVEITDKQASKIIGKRSEHIKKMDIQIIGKRNGKRYLYIPSNTTDVLFKAITEEQVSKIIGKGGNNINKMRKETTNDIEILGKYNENRYLYISNNDEYAKNLWEYYRV